MKTEFRKSFTNDLENVSDKNLLKRIRKVIEEIENTDTLAEIQNRKKLKGEKNCFRLKIGDYRFGLVLEIDTVIFVRFLHRKDIYKYFP